jgi:D-sedoheptulose 7-phosphate isomerase
MLAPDQVLPRSALALDEFIRQELDEHRGVLESTGRYLEQSLPPVLKMLEDSVRAGGKLLLFGNGGSAADAQHIAAELVIRYKNDRPAIAAVALTTDTSALTACGNDLGFDAIFSRQIDALARGEDIAIGISTSGRSPNVLAGLREARRKGARSVGLTGGNGGDMADVCDALVVVPSKVTARIQEMHIMIGHMLCKALEQRLGFT